MSRRRPSGRGSTGTGKAPAVGERTVEVTLPDTAHRLLTEHRIRLQVSGGAHPRFARNLGTGEPPLTGTALRPSTRTVHHAGSRLTIPVG